MKRRPYVYTAVICQPGGIWFPYEGGFSLETRRGVATPGAVPGGALKDAKRVYPRAIHVFVTKTRAIGPAVEVPGNG